MQIVISLAGAYQGRSDEGYIYPKSVQVDFLWGKMTSKWLLNMSIKFYTSPKNFIPQKQISGYAPGAYIDLTNQTDR